jgi:hypothetical protein
LVFVFDLRRGAGRGGGRERHGASEVDTGRRGGGGSVIGRDQKSTNH